MSLPPLRDVWPTYVQGHLSDLKNCTVQSSSRFIDFVNRGLLFTPNSSLNLIVKIADSCLKSMSQSKSMWESFCSKKIFCKKFACKLCEFLMQDIQRYFPNWIHILIAITLRMPKATKLSLSKKLLLPFFPYVLNIIVRNSKDSGELLSKQYIFKVNKVHTYVNYFVKYLL